ncbi:MAG: DUF59 domain-containing protein [Deltaproteobacteria bacterium]|nr:DUF59 domain-containing protein [Deltaproteobacteria bacterium]MBW2672304.1 DUF59 domain-containing protein [Deltaproteobacteria bacterium]
MVQGITVSKGTVHITVVLPVDHQFASNIKDEIMEKIRPLWDVKTVEVRFSE